MPLSPLILHITEALADLSIIGSLITRAASDPSVFTITDKAFYWMKVPTSAFTFKTLLRHNCKQVPKHGK